MIVMPCPLCNELGYISSLIHEEEQIYILDTTCDNCEVGETLDEDLERGVFFIAPELVMRIL